MTKLDVWVWRWSPVLLACLIVSVIALLLTVSRHQRQEFEEFKDLCTQSGGRALAYANGSDLCVDDEGRIVITR